MALADSPPRYRAFISYCHRNEKAARWLHKALETYRVPSALIGRQGEHGVVPRQLGRIFRDEDELAGASELGPQLQEALAQSSALIVVCSVEAVKSHWVEQEIRFFRRTFPDRPVLAMIANGVPGSEGEECFPEGLRYGVTADGALDREIMHEPLAPDLQKLDREGVKLKLIAGLLGVSYGELARRELKRQRRQLAAFGSLAVAVIAALLILSSLAFTYARMAVRERDVAREQRRIAEQNADLAERKAWLANVAAQEVRRQADLIGAGATRCNAAVTPKRIAK